MACKKVRKFLLCCFGSSRTEDSDGEDSYEYVGEISEDSTGAHQVFYRDDQSKTQDDKNDIDTGSCFNLSRWCCECTWDVPPPLPDRDYPIILASVDQKSSDDSNPEFKVKWDMEAEWRELGIDPVRVFGPTSCTSDYRQEEELNSDEGSLVSDHVKFSIDSGLSRSVSMPIVGSEVMSYTSTSQVEDTFPVERMDCETSKVLRISGGYSPVWKKTVTKLTKCWSLREFPHINDPKYGTKKRRKSFPIGQKDDLCMKLSSTGSIRKINDVKDYAKSAIQVAAFKQNGTEEASRVIAAGEYVGPDSPLVLPFVPHQCAECDKL